MFSVAQQRKIARRMQKIWERILLRAGGSQNFLKLGIWANEVKVRFIITKNSSRQISLLDCVSFYNRPP